MNAALTFSPTAPAADAGAHAAHGLSGLAQRIGTRLVAWSRAAEQRHVAAQREHREDLAELHRRRLEGARLRDEMRTSVYLTHTF